MNRILKKNAIEMKKKFEERGVLQQAIEKARRKNRNEIINKETNCNKIPFVTDYNPDTLTSKVYQIKGNRSLHNLQTPKHLPKPNL